METVIFCFLSDLGLENVKKQFVERFIKHDL